MDVQPTLGAEWANSMFHRAGVLAPEQSPMACPKVEAPMAGLVRRTRRPANARALLIGNP